MKNYCSKFKIGLNSTYSFIDKLFLLTKDLWSVKG